MWDSRSIVSHHVAAAADSERVGDQRGAPVSVVLVGALYRSVEKLHLALQRRSSLLRRNRLDVLERSAKSTRDLRGSRTGETDLIEGETDVALPVENGHHQAQRHLGVVMVTRGQLAGISGDGRYLYAIDADAQKVFGWTVGQDGQLTSVGEFEGVPETVAGLAAS